VECISARWNKVLQVAHDNNNQIQNVLTQLQERSGAAFQNWEALDANAAQPSERHDNHSASPPRRQRHDSPDASPPRRQRHDSPDASPPRRQRHDSLDASPPRRRVDESPDASPPKRQRHNSPAASPPRRPRDVDDASEFGLTQSSKPVESNKRSKIMSDGTVAGRRQLQGG